MKNLDLVVCPNTALAHLAGALGVPVWVPLARSLEWRWLWDRSDSPWYPTARVFRQERVGDWDVVFARMADALAGLASAPRRAGVIRVETAPGELVDKLTILEIKLQRISDPAKLANVRREFAVLAAVRDRGLRTSPELDALTAELRAVNESLWEVEDDLRQCEASRDFGPRFVELARAVYHTNDRRAALKRRINDLLGSRLIEEKDYQGAAATLALSQSERATGRHRWQPWPRRWRRAGKTTQPATWRARNRPFVRRSRRNLATPRPGVSGHRPPRTGRHSGSGRLLS